MRYLLDTHVLLQWLGSDARLSAEHTAVLDHVTADDPAWVSEISAWEIATLASLGRIRLDRPLLEWLERACALPQVRTIGISPAIAAGVAALPDSFHRDPADRIIVATTHVIGGTLLTVDEKIIDADIVPTLA